MSKIVKLRDLQLGQVTVRGWIEKLTPLKKFSFITLRDGVGKDCHVQVVIPQAVGEQVKLVIESYVEIEGTVRSLPETARSFRSVELEASKITVLGESTPEFSAKCPADAVGPGGVILPGAGPDVKLAERHIYIRDPKFALMTKLRAVLVDAMRQWFRDTDSTEIFPPSFVGNQCEGGSTLFKLDYPAKDKGDIPAYLSQSSQFYLEYALPGIGDCFCIAPSFRAERSHTRRHLTEFLHAECEWSGILTLEDHLEKLRSLVIGTVTYFLSYGRKYLDELGLTARVELLLKMCADIKVVTHRDAIEYCRTHDIYKDAETKTHFDYTDDIPEAQERRMIDEMDKIVFLVRFPRGFKSFYMQKAEDPEYVLGCDVEVPGVGEVVGSGVRVYDSQELKDRLKEQGLKEDEYCEYIELRKFGSGRTSGMGLGVDRFLTWLLGTHSIREVVTFPRYPGHLFP